MLQVRWKRLIQLLGLGSVVDDQSVQVLGSSELKLGLLEALSSGIQFVAVLDSNVLNVWSSSQFDELFYIGDFFLIDVSIQLFALASFHFVLTAIL